MPDQGAKPIWPELAGDQAGPLYGVFSEEDFLLAQAVEQFTASPSFAENPSLNIERFQAADAKPARILESAQTMPFLGSRRLIIVAGAEAFRAASLMEFADYLAEPAAFTCLLFCGRKLDMRTKFAKLLKKNGKLKVLKKLYPRELIPWLGQRAALRGKSLDQAAAARLAELSGLGLGALDSELEKLSFFVGAEKQIRLEHVLEVVGKGRLYSIFDFTDALAAGELQRALSAWDQLHLLGEPPVRVLAMITRLFKQLLQVRGVLDQGGGPSQVQSALRIPPAATATLVARAQKETGPKLGKRLGRILECDLALKSSPGSDRVIMERLVMDLCRA